jgi:hypothetical protein
VLSRCNSYRWSSYLWILLMTITEENLNEKQVEEFTPTVPPVSTWQRKMGASLMSLSSEVTGEGMSCVLSHANPGEKASVLSEHFLVYEKGCVWLGNLRNPGSSETAILSALCSLFEALPNVELTQLKLKIGKETLIAVAKRESGTTTSNIMDPTLT